MDRLVTGDARTPTWTGSVRRNGFGTARRNPVDRNLPAVGEEIAAARALGDLAHHLLERAAHEIESWEGHPVQLHG
jgi:hypothetical protein